MTTPQELENAIKKGYSQDFFDFCKSSDISLGVLDAALNDAIHVRRIKAIRKSLKAQEKELSEKLENADLVNDNELWLEIEKLKILNQNMKNLLKHMTEYVQAFRKDRSEQLHEFQHVVSLYDLEYLSYPVFAAE